MSDSEVIAQIATRQEAIFDRLKNIDAGLSTLNTAIGQLQTATAVQDVRLTQTEEKVDTLEKAVEKVRGKLLLAVGYLLGGGGLAYGITQQLLR